MLDHTGESLDPMLKVNFLKDPETIEVFVKCPKQDSKKVRKAFSECWILNRLSCNKMLTIQII